MFDSMKNLFKKKKNEGEKEIAETDDLKVEKQLDNLMKSSNSDQNTTSKSGSSSFYLENIDAERKILSVILKIENINAIDPIKLYEKFSIKIKNWKLI